MVVSLSPLVVTVLFAVELFIGVALILSALKLRKAADQKTLKNWSIASLVLAILANIFARLYLGSIIALLGGIVGYWYSRKILTKAPLAPFILVLVGGLLIALMGLYGVALELGVL